MARIGEQHRLRSDRVESGLRRGGPPAILSRLRGENRQRGGGKGKCSGTRWHYPSEWWGTSHCPAPYGVAAGQWWDGGEEDPQQRHMSQDFGECGGPARRNAPQPGRAKTKPKRQARFVQREGEGKGSGQIPDIERRWRVRALTKPESARAPMSGGVRGRLSFDTLYGLPSASRRVRQSAIGRGDRRSIVQLVSIAAPKSTVTRQANKRLPKGLSPFTPFGLGRLPIADY